VVALVALIAVAAVGYGAAAQIVEMPLFNPDELRYTIAARGLADGEWLNLRGATYGYGAVYPLVLAPVLALAPTVTSAYPYVKLLDALLFALAAVPIYLLARRLLSPWWSVGVAAASVAIPSSMYTSLVLTESVSYLTASVALLAVVLALERPSVVRQLAMLAAVLLAYATRPQFAALVVAFLGGALLLWALESRRPRFRDAVVRLWPTVVPVSIGVAGLAVRLLVTPTSANGSLGGYADLWREYDVVPVARFAVYHLAAWELYVFVVPFVVAPIVVADLLRAARRGAKREGAFVAAFLGVSAVMLLIAAAFASTPYGYSELHDRYLFYVAPLWLATLAVWLSRGMPRPLAATAVGAALALVLPAVLPFGLVGGNIVVEEVPTALWSWAWTVVESTPHLDGRRVLGVTVVALTFAAVAMPRRLWPILPALVIAGFVLTSVLAWKREVDVPVAFAEADTGDRTWVDDSLPPEGAKATKLYVSAAGCPGEELRRHAFFLTEFFNTSVDRVAAIDGAMPDGLPIDSVEVARGGRLVRADGSSLAARYVVTQPEVRLSGRRLATGTGARLVLWETDGLVRLANPRLRTKDVLAASCR
jgi:hypothetical protein